MLPVVYIVKRAKVSYCMYMRICIQYLSYDSQTRVSRFARQHNGSDKRPCCKTIGKFSASIIIEQAVTPLRSFTVFYKAPKHVPTIFYTRYIPLLFFPRSVLARRTKPKWAHSSLTASRIRFRCRTFRVVCHFIVTFRKRFDFIDYSGNVFPPHGPFVIIHLAPRVTRCTWLWSRVLYFFASGGFRVY